jgi:hypothetical protein
MNEKIKQFGEQAIHYAASRPMPELKDRDLYLDNLFEKFAELIVRECIGIVEPTSHHEAFAQGYMGGIDGLDLLYSKVKQIKEHFGTEE